MGAWDPQPPAQSVPSSRLSGHGGTFTEALAQERLMSIWEVGWKAEKEALYPLKLFLIIDPGWTEGQQARDRCIRVDIASERERHAEWLVAWQEPGRGVCARTRVVFWERDGPKNVHPGIMVHRDMVFLRGVEWAGPEY